MRHTTAHSAVLTITGPDGQRTLDVNIPAGVVPTASASGCEGRAAEVPAVARQATSI
jgi:hypothetical protein